MMGSSDAVAPRESNIFDGRSEADRKLDGERIRQPLHPPVIIITRQSNHIYSSVAFVSFVSFVSFASFASFASFPSFASFA